MTMSASLPLCRPGDSRMPDTTHYTLTQPRCPCCRDEGALIFARCPDCRHVFGVCEETGTMVDLQRFEIIPFACPGCATTFATFADIEPISQDELRRLGYSSNQVTAGTGRIFN